MNYATNENCTNCNALTFTSSSNMQTTYMYYQLAVKWIQSLIFENYLLVD